MGCRALCQVPEPELPETPPVYSILQASALGRQRSQRTSDSRVSFADTILGRASRERASGSGVARTMRKTLLGA